MQNNESSHQNANGDQFNIRTVTFGGDYIEHSKISNEYSNTNVKSKEVSSGILPEHSIEDKVVLGQAQQRKVHNREENHQQMKYMNLHSNSNDRNVTISRQHSEEVSNQPINKDQAEYFEINSKQNTYVQKDQDTNHSSEPLNVDYSRNTNDTYDIETERLVYYQDVKNTGDDEYLYQDQYNENRGDNKPSQQVMYNANKQINIRTSMLSGFKNYLTSLKSKISSRNQNHIMPQQRPQSILGKIFGFFFRRKKRSLKMIIGTAIFVYIARFIREHFNIPDFTDLFTFDNLVWLTVTIAVFFIMLKFNRKN